jgi:ornithine cyclodeaminase
MRFLGNDDVAALLSPVDALAAVRAAFEAWGDGRAAVQRRERTSVGDVKLSTLGAVVVDPDDPDGGVVGAKVYSTVGGRFTFLIALFAASDGRRLAVLEADVVTRLRTAATSTLAAQLLARAGAARLVVHGSGVQATGHIEAMVPALGLGHVTIVGRTPPTEVAAKLAADLGVEVEATDDRFAGLDAADVVVTATRSTTPLFPGVAVPPGAFVCAVGSSRPDTRELDADAYAVADRVVVEWRRQARDEAGGLVQAAADGDVAWDDVAELADVVAGVVPGRRRDDERFVFQSVGIGLEDVAVAASAWRASTSL